jgi:hypothetical protein
MADGNNSTLDLGRLAENYRKALQPGALARLADQLGISVESLRRLGIGWAAEHRAWVFPMTDRDHRVRGIRLRLPDGHKLSVRGGREGLFIPEGLTPADDLLLVSEGPTDTAALLDLNFQAVGRPSCTGGLRLLVEAVLKWRPREVVVVADSDPPGQRGAENLAHQLLVYCAVVRLITPPAPFKDVRLWKMGGATRANFLAAIDAAPVRELTITVMGRGSK